jgi:hypothetical protein
MFKRIDPENKDKRVALILVNYNMLENTNSIIENLISCTNYPTDFIVVDNGSDLTKPSEYTTLKLEKNVQTTNGWLMGLHYADAISVCEGFKYYAYIICITSLYINNKDTDIIEHLVKKLTDEIVGIHPSLCKESTTAHKHLMCKNSKELREVKFIDNIFSVYKADWFNSIGRFNPEMIYAWAVDLETGYLARKSDKKVCVDDTIQVKKITDIGYKLKRMNMEANVRRNRASKQMHNYLRKKYGSNYKTLMW